MGLEMGGLLRGDDSVIEDALLAWLKELTLIGSYLKGGSF